MRPCGHQTTRLLCSQDSLATILERAGGASGKESALDAVDAGDEDSIPGQEDPLEEEMATQSSILIWIIPRTEEPVGLKEVHGGRRVGTRLSN